DSGIRDERSCNDIENRVRIGLERRAPRLECDATQDDRRARFCEQNGTPGGIHLGAGGGAGAFVLGIVYAVAIGIAGALATHAIDLSTRGGIRALVDAVGDAVMIAVDRTARAVHCRTGRRIGTLIDAVRHAVVIGVGRAALCVDTSAGRSARALVDPVINAVAVRILGAAPRVHFRGLHRVRTGIEPVIHTVSVGLARTTLRVYRGAGGRGGAVVALIGDAIQVRIAKATRPGEDRQSSRAHDVAGPRAGARESAARGIDRAALDTKCDTIAEEDAVADGAMDRIVGEAVAGVVAEPKPSITAKDI